MKFYGYGIVHGGGERDSGLVFPSPEAAQKYIRLKDTYFLKTGDRVVELYYKELSDEPTTGEK